MNVENRVSKLNEIIKEAAKVVCPVTEMSRKKWISVTTLELAKEKREVRLKMKESNEMVDKYQKLCNEVKASARKDKQEWFDKQCEKIEQSQEQQKAKEVYQLVRSVNKNGNQSRQQ